MRALQTAGHVGGHGLTNALPPCLVVVSMAMSKGNAAQTPCSIIRVCMMWLNFLGFPFRLPNKLTDSLRIILGHTACCLLARSILDTFLLLSSPFRSETAFCK